MLKVSIGCDHGGYAAKEALKKALEEQGYIVIDEGTNSLESCHYPLYARRVAERVSDKLADFGVVLCTSGEGVCMTANKVRDIRCGIAYNDEVAALMRKHNDANVIAFGAKFMTEEEIIRRTNIFLETQFEGGRHLTRVEMIKEIEKK